jgi:ABC-type sugar transport system substrate-binding protein
LEHDMMRTSLALLAAAAALAAAPAAFAQPTPNEERGMFIGDAHTNGVATIVTDQYGTHPEGYPGFSPINHAAADSRAAVPASDRHTRHHRHHRDVEGR